MEENNLNHYYKNGLLVATVGCDWKCLKEQGLDISICQNSHTSKMQTKFISTKELVDKFNENLLSECIIFAGLEPILQFDEVYGFIKEFRKTNYNDVVIFTGYYPEEIKEELEKLKSFENIYIKLGRYIQNSSKIYDPIGKIWLSGSNQYFIKL